MEDSIQVLKFGGTSVGSGERIRRVASIIGHHLRDGKGMFPVIVVSAMSGVTDQLLRIERFACTGDHESWQQELEADDNWARQTREKNTRFLSERGNFLEETLEKRPIEARFTRATTQEGVHCIATYSLHRRVRA